MWGLSRKRFRGSAECRRRASAAKRLRVRAELRLESILWTKCGTKSLGRHSELIGRQAGLYLHVSGEEEENRSMDDGQAVAPSREEQGTKRGRDRKLDVIRAYIILFTLLGVQKIGTEKVGRGLQTENMTEARARRSRWK